MDRYNIKNNPISNFKIGADTHSFNVSLAKRFGLIEAIIIQHSYYWYGLNKGNPDMNKDGKVWFFRSVSQISEVYPYLTVDKVRRTIDRLVEVGILIKGNYSFDKFKKANWYSLSDEMINIMKGENAESIQQNAEPLGKMPNDSAKCQLNYSNIDDNKEDSKTKEDTNVSKKADIDYDSIVLAWNNVAKDIVGVSLVKTLTDKRKKSIRNLISSCKTNVSEIIKLINTIPYADDWVLGKGCRNWYINFDFLINNTSGWYVRALEGDMHKKNKYEFDKIMNGDILSLQDNNSDSIKFQF